MPHLVGSKNGVWNSLAAIMMYRHRPLSFYMGQKDACGLSTYGGATIYNSKICLFCGSWRELDMWGTLCIYKRLLAVVAAKLLPIPKMPLGAASRLWIWEPEQIVSWGSDWQGLSLSSWISSSFSESWEELLSVKPWHAHYSVSPNEMSLNAGRGNHICSYYPVDLGKSTICTRNFLGINGTVVLLAIAVEKVAAKWTAISTNQNGL